MATKDELLKLLKENEGKYVSGEYISKLLGVTRNSIWKSINSLRKAGFRIDAVTNKGYKLDSMDIFSNISISPYLDENITVKHYESITSTNDIVMDLGRSGKKENIIIVADEQTKGRGRKGRKFYSPNKSGLYFSILLTPNLNIQESLYITAIAAVSVVKTIEEITGVKSYIKWVNDIYIDNKKICGILTDAKFDIESGMVEYAAVGIGINLYEPEENFPNNINKIATSIFKNKKIDNEIKNRIIANIINKFFYYYRNINDKSFMKEYIDKSFIIGKEVVVDFGDRKEKVKALSIDENCKLEIMYSNGNKEKITYGEVSLEL